MQPSNLMNRLADSRKDISIGDMSGMSAPREASLEGCRTAPQVNGTVVEGVRSADDGRFTTEFRDDAFDCDEENSHPFQLHPWISKTVENDVWITVCTHRNLWNSF